MKKSVKNRRLGAAIIDGMFIFFSIFIFSMFQIIMLPFFSIIEFFIITLLFIYYTIFPLFTNGSTLGKLILGIKITTIDYQKPRFYQFLLRNILFFEAILVFLLPTIFGIIFFILSFFINIIIFFMVMLGKEERGIHDYIANTLVVDRSFDITLVNQVDTLEQKQMTWAIFNDTKNDLTNQVSDDEIEILKKKD
ncbi:MAG TPA: RDD family protein [Haloplasmataceae bacterium]